jgi:homocysteine S-methyltransferase
MASAADVLPQLGDQLFLTDSGLETDLIFHHGVELPCFAAFPLIDTASGRDLLAGYYREHAAVAAAHHTGFVFEAPTWRASADWGAQLGYDARALKAVNHRAIELLTEVRDEAGLAESVLSGCLGPRADGYAPQTLMSAAEARAYHRPQLESLRETAADLANAMTITYPAEAIGIVQAAVEVGLPVSVSFTVETDGRLADGTTLADAIRAVDDETNAAAAYFQVNCAHPDHVALALSPAGDATNRLRGLRANASRRSHGELDDAPDLDDGDPFELAAGYQQLRTVAPNLTILGGCCGTDVRHVRAIADAVSGG